ncbi:uncharacterized protein [Choristoneura fumiferana]|uniref:uncharacterized protein n=1 Tax=Choristoneura fumiferana TaxID=7141 RepID=UPI003D156CEC
MFHILAFCLLAAAAAAPATYDQRQDGDFNVRADVQNVVLVVAYPSKMKVPISELFDSFKNANKEYGFQERADVRITEAFVEPNTPYRVDIGSDSERYADSDGRNVEVVIAGRRRLEAEPTVELDGEKEEYKLLGALEQCGPEGERDPVTLACRPRAPEPEPSPMQPNEPQKPEEHEKTEPAVVSV